MVDNFYDSQEEARFRLANTVVEYDGEAVYVSSVENHDDGVLRVKIVNMPLDAAVAGGGKAQRKLINSPKFRRFQTVKMGWCNHFENGMTQASFVERTPVRRSKQGLSAEAYAASLPHPNRDGGRGLMRSSLSFNQAIHSVAFCEMVRGEYPTYEDTIKMLVNNSSIAVSHDFLIQRSGEGLLRLWYKKDIVGTIVRGQIFLFENFGYLRETIMADKQMPNDVEVGV